MAVDATELHRQILEAVTRTQNAVRRDGATPFPLVGPHPLVDLTDALRAVVELHAPMECEDGCCWFCAGCEAEDANSTYWVDCKNVRAVAGALGVEIAR